MKLLNIAPIAIAAAGILAGPLSAGQAADKPIEITRLGTFATGIFSDQVSGAEISAHDPRTQRLFVVNGAQNRIDVLDIRDPAAPTKLFHIDCAPFGGQPNSVAVNHGVVAVAVENIVKTDPGTAVFFDADGRFLNRVTVGALPDMIAFTPNGQFVLVANEGEPNDAVTVDPEGSVSIIRLPAVPGHIKQSDVRTADFSAFTVADLDPSVRVFGPAGTVAQNLEPEYITVSQDSRTAWVTLQEANAIATIDIRSATVTAIRGLGFKDHSHVDAIAETFNFDPATLPPVGWTAAGQQINLGGFSGLAFEGIDPATGRYKFITNTDRGPNGDPTGLLRPFLLPGFSPEVVRFELDRSSGAITITQRIALKRADGVTPITGLPNLQVPAGTAGTPHHDEVGVDLFGNTLPLDPLGGDFEGIVVDPFTLAVINDNDFQVAGIVIDNATGIFSLADGYHPGPVTLGLIDMESNSLDASDRDGVVNIRPWPVKGMYLPDTIDSFRVNGRHYLITANEGDSRDYAGFSEEARVKDLALDASAFPLRATLRKDENLGRLKVTNSRGDTDGDGDFDELYSFGARSFAIWDETGTLVFDSGDAIEQIIAADPVFGAIFNAGHTNITRDDRSDDKGPEPESVVVGRLGSAHHAFVGLERVGGFMVFDVSNPSAPRFIRYVNNRDPATRPALGVGGDTGPEGLLFIEASASPIGAALLVVTNEVSSTVTLYRID